jgi:hypothetical protein
MFTAKKQPTEILDFDVDLEQWFENAPGDEIESVSTAVALLSGVEGGGTTLSVSATNLVGDPALAAKIWLTGGVTGCAYKVTATLETEGGRRKQVEFKVNVKET